MLAREVQQLTHVEEFDLDTTATAAHIRRGGHQRVALQFPDELLSHAGPAVEGLRAALGSDGHEGAVDIFVLGDTTFDGFQVDFVTAQHLEADLVVHYGPVDLEAEGPLPVRFILGHRPLDIAAAAAAIAVAVDGDRRMLVVPSLPYAHTSEALAARLLAECPSALLCHADLERRAAVPAAQPSSSVGGAPGADGGSAATASASTSLSTSVSDEAALTPASQIARGRLLGRRLPCPLDEAALASCSLLYIGGEDQTLSNLCMLLPNAEVRAAPPAPPRSPTPPPLLPLLPLLPRPQVFLLEPGETSAYASYAYASTHALRSSS